MANIVIQRQEQIVAEFEKLTDWEDRYKKLIELGKSLPELSDEKKQEDFLIKGCQSQVWMHAKKESGLIFFEADSDALLVRGLVALLLKVYSGALAEDIISTPPEFIKKIGLETKLTPSRANGLVAMIKQMKFYALALADAK